MRRREFIKTTALGTVAAATWPRSATARDANLKLGVIGCGWYGMVVSRAAFEVGGVEVIAACDVDSEHLENSANELAEIQGFRPQTFKDYRDLLEVEGLEAVVIATPPQWHALQFIDACDRGLDIFCEKPLAYDIREGQAMVEAAKASGNVVQIGFQRRQSPAIREAAEYIRGGNAGRIVQVDANIHYTAGVPDTTIQDPPDSLDWDMWCGPGPLLPYRPSIGHFAWRLEEAYGNGHMVDWGIHLIDAVRHALGETTPKAVQAAGGLYQLKGEITTPDTLTAHFEFETCPVVWRHRIWGSAEHSPDVQNGIFFFGEQETIFATDGRWMIIPRDEGKERQVFELDASHMQRDHVADFLQAVRNRTKPSCDTEDGYYSTATVQLGMIAYHAGSRIEWNESRKELSGNEAALTRLKRAYREPWVHPYEG